MSDQPAPYVLRAKVEIEGIRTAMVQHFGHYTKTLNEQIEAQIKAQLESLDLEAMVKAAIDREAQGIINEMIRQKVRWAIQNGVEKIAAAAVDEWKRKRTPAHD